MERIIKILILILLFCTCSVKAEEINSAYLVTPQYVDYKYCTRSYIMPADKLFYISIAAANANKFVVDEIQSKTGYILFTAVGKQYIASVHKINSTQSQLKITPVNNNYFFAPGVVLNFFRYIDLNGSTPFVELQKT